MIVSYTEIQIKIYGVCFRPHKKPRYKFCNEVFIFIQRGSIGSDGGQAGDAADVESAVDVEQDRFAGAVGEHHELRIAVPVLLLGAQAPQIPRNVRRAGHGGDAGSEVGVGGQGQVPMFSGLVEQPDGDADRGGDEFREPGIGFIGVDRDDPPLLAAEHPVGRRKPVVVDGELKPNLQREGTFAVESEVDADQLRAEVERPEGLGVQEMPVLGSVGPVARTGQGREAQLVLGVEGGVALRPQRLHRRRIGPGRSERDVDSSDLDSHPAVRLAVANHHQRLPGQGIRGLRLDNEVLRRGSGNGRHEGGATQNDLFHLFSVCSLLFGFRDDDAVKHLDRAAESLQQIVHGVLRLVAVEQQALRETKHPVPKRDDLPIEISLFHLQL